MNKALETQKLTLGYGEAVVIDALDIAIPKGKITILVGANGCGKSTLLRALARLLKPRNGEIHLNGLAMHKSSTKEVAKQLAILPQGPTAPEGLTVKQLVKQGRYPHQSFLKPWSKADDAIVEEVLEATGMTAFAHRNVLALSGGQRQRAWIAMSLAQKTDVLLLDEPTTYLDLTHQIEVLDLLFELNEKDSRTVVMVLHDLNLACRYAHNIVAVKDKGVYAQGPPEEVVTEEMVKSVFGMSCVVTSDPLFGTPLCIPHGKGRKLSAV